MSDSRKVKLIDLGAEALADAMLDLSIHSDEADRLIDHLIATPEEKIQRYKKKLTSLKRSKRFIDWKASSEFVWELEVLLQDLKSGVADPLTGIKLVVAFYETDGSILGRCDDSDGNVGDVFRFDAKELFLEYASQCDEKKKIADIVLKLNRKDSYGIRDTLVDCASEYLPEPTIRTMISKLQKQADKEKDEYRRRQHLMLIESLARQIRDAKLFERTRIASWGKLSTAAFIDIASVYLESGDVETAHSLVCKVPEDGAFKAYERDQLLIEIYKRQGNVKKLTELLYQNFRSHHSVSNLEALLDIIGDDRRDNVLANEIKHILESDTLRESDVRFLISTGKIDEAEEYILKHADQLNGDNYGSLPPLAEAMESENRDLAASMLYRSLLISILRRGYTKAYSHGVRYLEKLDKLSTDISNWKGFDSHDVFKGQIYQAHGRKRSFWSKYEVKNE